jgi:hypothetical protein
VSAIVDSGRPRLVAASLVAALLAGFAISAYLVLPPNPHAVAPLYLAPASAIVAVPAAILLILVPPQRRIGDALTLALLLVTAALPLLVLRMLTHDYESGSYQRGLERRELMQGLFVATSMALLFALFTAAFVFDRARRVDAPPALRHLGIAALLTTAAAIAGAFLASQVLDADLFFDDRSGSLVPAIFGIVIVVSLAAGLGSKLGFAAAPLAAWPAWMTIVLLQERQFWENDVSQGDMARTCVRYAVFNGLVAGAAIAVAMLAVRLRTLAAARAAPVSPPPGPEGPASGP